MPQAIGPIDVMLSPHHQSNLYDDVCRPEHSGSRDALWRVGDKERNLRRQAEHCRRLADGTVGERTRAILLVMAADYEEQAALIDLPGTVVP